MFSGSTVALVSPMEVDGSINYQNLARLIEFHIHSGTECLVIAGTTGESATLAHNEHIELVTRACEIANGRIPILAGTGSNSTKQTIELSKTIDQLPVSGFLVVTPYYNKPTQNGMIKHYSIIADELTKPIILYNVPGRTGVDLKVETVIKLSAHVNIAGVKEATGEIDRVKQLRDGCGESFKVLSGDDITCCEFMLLGGDGCISVTANVVPKQMRALCDTARSGNRLQAEEIDNKISGLHRDLFLESNPIPVKWAVEKLGYISSGIRLPLTNLSTEHHKKVSKSMEQAGIL